MLTKGGFIDEKSKLIASNDKDGVKIENWTWKRQWEDLMGRDRTKRHTDRFI